MTDDGSSRGMFWLGGVAGLIVAGSLAAMLSLATPLERTAGESDGAAVSSPEPSPEPGDAPDTSALLADAPETRRADPPGPVVRVEEDTLPSQDKLATGDSAATPKPIGAAEPTPEPAPAPTGDDTKVTPTVTSAPEVPTVPEAADPAADAGAEEAAAAESAQPQITAPAAPAPAPAPALSAPEPVSQPEPDKEEGAGQTALGAPAFRANAALWEGDRTRPLMAIVLTGLGAPGQDEALQSVLLLPAPLTGVLAPDAPQHALRAADLRHAGFEVLIGVDAARLGDDPVAAISPLLDDAGPVIGAAALGEGMVKPALAELLVVEAEARGMALLDLSGQGGAAPYRMAQEAGLPSAPKGANFDEIAANLVFLTLDRASADAVRAGALVVTAEATPTVLSGLRRWLRVRGGVSATLAPLSVVMERMAPGGAE